MNKNTTFIETLANELKDLTLKYKAATVVNKVNFIGYIELDFGCVRNHSMHKLATSDVERKKQISLYVCHQLF